MPWTVYVLKCRDGTYYTGSTAHAVEERLKVHNAGKGSKYVRSRRPATLIYTERHYNQSEALKRECQIKRLSRRDKQALWRPLKFTEE